MKASDADAYYDGEDVHLTLTTNRTHISVFIPLKAAKNLLKTLTRAIEDGEREGGDTDEV